ncbi:NAD-dependent epimerase/dehydratase family protein [Pseudoduganella umbonata]|uniref:NAD(P)-dependent oxidoreductase n=1 Tax=Pseudoduganella umbonata TaxID=864828 RepID=A0A4P8HLH7_9BURK|nr:NAD(P)-dependent oxidoreductase [Pseudoduganella umbonata]MBB3221602.1 nucleoside-diphosphate-sugar epimerase [Pseudoduganella umbonata]QCP09162.1 NAD(P)-dependent oxidoreductase [Pseudoduganella umbonata]
MTVLITGGTGLVGQRLLRRLIKNGIACQGLVRRSNELPLGTSEIVGDILDPASLSHAVTGVSAIIHLAAVFRTPDEELIWKVNLEGTRNLINAAKAYAPEARFIMASTSNVYEIDATRPGREDDCVEPTLAYPASKLAAENALRASGLNWSIQRYGFIYGDSDGHIEAIHKHLQHAKWHPAHKMSMIHHRDIANAMTIALAGAMDGHIVNIVDEAPTSIYELLKLVGLELEPSSEPLVHPWHLHVDGSLARRLGFIPTVATVHQAYREGIL